MVDLPSSIVHHRSAPHPGIDYPSANTPLLDSDSGW